MVPAAAPTGVVSSTAAFVADVLGVVVLYGRAFEDTPTFQTVDEALRASAARLSVLVYDNSPRPAPTPHVTSERWDVHVVSNPSNPGVSAAYLAGAELARHLGKRWLILLDQDTRVPVDGLDAYARAVAEFPGEQLFAPVLRARSSIVSPCRYRFVRGAALPAVVPGCHDLVAVSVLNSGMCVRRDAYERTGGHDRRIPLDFSDHEFVARFAARHPTRASFVVIDATFEHGFSGLETHTLAQRVSRFDAYCRGAVRAGRGPGYWIAVRTFVLARAALLAWRWRSVAFLMVPFRASRDHG